ncbi:hypothetical protein HW555_007380 [Spodoptera exigua]|uniref:Uncharacterized protein n=1 Tax=Spodoptera exigua TaxID=7107 RepID=A0A835GCV6_SPOEX|nr:hypothetical protein HW555_007380 [Spodoptera exigua]
MAILLQDLLPRDVPINLQASAGESMFMILNTSNDAWTYTVVSQITLPHSGRSAELIELNNLAIETSSRLGDTLFGRSKNTEKNGMLQIEYPTLPDVVQNPNVGAMEGGRFSILGKSKVGPFEAGSLSVEGY